jgi:transposase
MRKNLEKLTDIQKRSLESSLKKTRQVDERNRLCVILGYDKAIPVDMLANVLHLSHSTIYNYLQDYHKEEKTQNEPRGGRESKFSQEQSQELIKHLSDTTYLKTVQICSYVKEKYGITYSRSGMTAWLKDQDFVYKRPKKVPGKLDPQKQGEFIEQYKELKANLKPDEEIYFIDALHPEHQSQAVCGWIKKGEQKTLQTTGKQLRIHLSGALSLEGIKVFTQEYETIDSEAMVDFLKKLEKSSSAKTIYVIMDNARSNKNKKIEEFLETSKSKIRYLPPYSPNLNPIERLWKIMREKKMYNRYYETSVSCFQEIRSFFKNEVPELAHTWSTRINDNFQTIKLNHIKIAV